MQKTLDQYGAGVQIQQVQMQKIDPPLQVIDAFRDVQAARADLERAQNEAQTYANQQVPEARGKGRANSRRRPTPTSRRPSPRRTGQTSRFTARSTRNTRRLPTSRASACISETMERILAGTDKIILDSNNGQSGSGVVPYLPLNELRRPAGDHAAERRCAMRLGTAGVVALFVIIVAAVLGYLSLFTVYQTQQAIVVRLGEPVRVVDRAGSELQVAADRQRDHDRQAHPRPGKPGAGGDRLRPEAPRGGRVRALPHPATR